MYDAIFKVVIFGDAGCGKTTLTKRFMTGTFIPGSNMTIGVNFETKCIDIDGMQVKLMLWDFGGEERFRFIFPQYIVGTMGGILMYDITDPSSFSHVIDWISLLNGQTGKIPILLLGSKLDLESFREISYDEGKSLANSMRLSKYFECSSKTGDNVEASFEELTRMMINSIMY